MEFSVKWAAASAAYVGMIAGVIRMWPDAMKSAQSIYGLGVGALFGGGLALPLCASNLVAALLTVWIARGRDFPTQVGVFALMSFLFYYLTLQMLSRGLRMMGGLRLDAAELAWHAGFVVASLGVALLLMRFAPSPAAG